MVKQEKNKIVLIWLIPQRIIEQIKKTKNEAAKDLSQKKRLRLS